MIPWEQINDLSRRRGELKLTRDFVGMLPLCEKEAQLLEESGADARSVADAINYLAALNLRLERYSVAENYARRSVSYYEEHGGTDHEVLATYLSLLSWTLAFQGRFDEAIPFAEKAVAEFSVFHSPEDDFLTRCKSELNDLRNRKVSVDFDF
jgi:tetratricopeptide (TPR) repeat protein